MPHANECPSLFLEGYYEIVKDLRNEIDYRGVQVSPELWKKNKLKVEVVIRALKEYVTLRLQ